MSEPTAGGATVVARAPASGPPLGRTEEGEESHRGRLVVDDRVVEKVAAYAVHQVDGATGAPRRLLGVTVGEAHEDGDARVKAHVDGSIATVEVALAVRWPASVRQVAAETRRRVREEVARITDVEVRQIDIEVVSMTVADRSQPRVR